MKYRCLVLDHDDTVVASSAQIHYPSFIEYLKLVRPNANITFDEFLRKNFHPGFLDLCYNTFEFSGKEMKEEEEFWKNFIKGHIPTAYIGIKDILRNYKNNGGLICVVSHSLSENIQRDYEKNELPMPDMIFGWERPQNERKPSPYPLEQIMLRFSLKPSELLVVDDLKPGYDMAKKCKIDFAAAGWAYEISEIQNYMKKHSNYYLAKVEDLERIVYS